MSKLTNIKAREIIDSRGNPTLECDLTIENNYFGRASVPSGASTGKYEALELRDNNTKFAGRGVQKAVENILSIISPKIIDKHFDNIIDFDENLIQIDGTKNKSNLGANTILALSLAFAKALSRKNNKDLFEFLFKDKNFILPVPMINIINGGAHADNDIDFQEFMIMPIGASTFKESIQNSFDVIYVLKNKLIERGYNTNVGDEGGFAPNIRSIEEVLDLIIESINLAGFKLNVDFKLSIDVASSEFYTNSKYNLKGQKKIYTSDKFIDYLSKLIKDYSIYSIEDPLSEDDWDGWKELTNQLGNNTQLVGDDLFVTNYDRLNKGIDMKVANSILIKVNQIGSLSETLSVINLAKKNNYSFIISHRSGETEDTTISDLSVATSSCQIKTGSLSRTDRTSKYNQLLRIEEKLGSYAKYAGNSILKY